MNETILNPLAEETIAQTEPDAFKAILGGGAVVGTLDCAAATISSALKGGSFTRVWQYVASGLLGKDSYNYGAASVALGLLIHFFIAFSVVAAFYLVSRRLPVLTKYAVPFGAVYGVAVYFFMGYVIVPLSAVQRIPFSFSGLVTGILIHIFCIGVPAALIVRHFSKRADLKN